MHIIASLTCTSQITCISLLDGSQLNMSIQVTAQKTSIVPYLGVLKSIPREIQGVNSDLLPCSSTCGCSVEYESSVMSGYFYSHRPSPQFGPGHPHGPPPFLPLHLHSPHAPHHTELPRPYDPRLQPRAPSPWQPEAIGSPRPLFSPQEQQAIPQSMSMYRLPLMPPSGVPLIHGFNMAAPPPPVIAGPPNGGSLLGQYQSETGEDLACENMQLYVLSHM